MTGYPSSYSREKVEAVERYIAERCMAHGGKAEINHKDISEAVEMTRSTVGNIIQGLAKAGKISIEGRGPGKPSVLTYHGSAGSKAAQSVVVSESAVEYAERLMGELQTTIKGILREYESVKTITDKLEKIGETPDEIFYRRRKITAPTLPEGVFYKGNPVLPKVEDIKLPEETEETEDGEPALFPADENISWG